MRITTVISSLGCGGAERNLLKISAGLVETGHDLVLLTLRHDVEDFFVIPSGVQRERVDPAFERDCRWFDLLAHVQKWWLLRRALLASRPDVVMSFIDTNNILVLLSLFGSRIPVVACERVNMQSHAIGWRWRLLRVFVYPFAAAVVVQTRQASLRAIRRHRSWRLVQIPNWIESPRDGLIWPGQRHGLDRSDVVQGAQILAVGRLHQQKGFDLLIRAFAALPRRHQQVRLVILGEGAERSALERLVAELHLEDRVFLPGSVPNPEAWMVGTELFVLSSRYEGFPTVLAEAMALGCPVISMDCPDGPNEMIRHGLNGLLVPPEDEQTLAKSMSQLLDDRTMCQRLGVAAQQITQRYARLSIIQQWQQLIESVSVESH